TVNGPGWPKAALVRRSRWSGTVTVAGPTLGGVGADGLDRPSPGVAGQLGEDQPRGGAAGDGDEPAGGRAEGGRRRPRSAGDLGDLRGGAAAPVLVQLDSEEFASVELHGDQDVVVEPFGNKQRRALVVSVLYICVPV